MGEDGQRDSSPSARHAFERPDDPSLSAFAAGVASHQTSGANPGAIVTGQYLREQRCAICGKADGDPIHEPPED